MQFMIALDNPKQGSIVKGEKDWSTRHRNSYLFEKHRNSKFIFKKWFLTFSLPHLPWLFALPFQAPLSMNML